MAFKSQLGAGLLLAVYAVICGCQNTPPRNPSSPGFAQRPSVPPAGSANPPMVTANPPQTQLNGVPPPYSASPPGISGGVPTTSPATAGGQFRSTQPFVSGSGQGPSTFGASPPPPPPPPGSSFGAPGFDNSIQAPANPALGGPGLR
jgi:hypothetical protein